MATTLKCNICQNNFSTKSSLKRHANRHGPKSYTCEVCDKQFFRKDELSQHINGTHSDETSHICDQCGMRFKSRASLHNHKKMKHLHYKYNCSVCGKTFSTKQNKDVHERSHRPKSECSTCHKWFTHLKNHQQRCNKPPMIKHFICDTCGMKFAENKYLRDHTNTKHGPHRYSCSLCSATFAYRSGLRNHRFKCKK